MHVPELDAAVGSPAPRGQEVGLEGAPGQGLHRGLVAQQGVHRFPASQVPHQQPIVIAPGGQVLPIGGPLQAAHFQGMAPQLRCDVLPHPAQCNREFAPFLFLTKSGSSLEHRTGASQLTEVFAGGVGDGSCIFSQPQRHSEILWYASLHFADTWAALPNLLWKWEKLLLELNALSLFMHLAFPCLLFVPFTRMERATNLLPQSWRVRLHAVVLQGTWAVAAHSTA